MRFRKNWRRMLRVDKDRVIRAILEMKKAPDTFQKYSDMHVANMPEAHDNLNFLAWHRIFILLFEQDMVAADIALGNDGKIGLPYWNWAVDNSPDPSLSKGWMWRSEVGGLHIGVGPNGVDNGSGEVDDNFKVEDGAFKEGPDWVVTAAGSPDWIRRKLNEVSAPTQAHIDRALDLTDFDTGDMDDDSGLTSSFRNVLEGWASNHVPPQVPGLHNRGHVWVGGRFSLPQAASITASTDVSAGIDYIAVPGSFKISVDGSAVVTISLTANTSGVVPTNVGGLVPHIQELINTNVGPALVTVSYDSGTGFITLTTISVGSASSLVITDAIDTGGAIDIGSSTGLQPRRPGTLALTPIAPNDPVFFFHHANIDRIWATWQERHRALPQYPIEADIITAQATHPTIRKVDEDLEPWLGIAGTSGTTAQDVLSTTALGGPFSSADNYRYANP